MRLAVTEIKLGPYHFIFIVSWSCEVLNVQYWSEASEWTQFSQLSLFPQRVDASARLHAVEKNLILDS